MGNIIDVQQGKDSIAGENQDQELLFRHDINVVILCIDSYNPEQQTGRLYHQYTKNPLCFFSLIEALEQMELFYDDIRFPFASTKMRSFFIDRKAGERRIRKSKETSGAAEYGRKDMRQMEISENAVKHRGTDATFIIRVNHRQHSSWQGEVTWIDKKKKEYFRSALELIKLIDGALNDSDDVRL